MTPIAALAMNFAALSSFNCMIIGNGYSVYGHFQIFRIRLFFLFLWARDVWLLSHRQSKGDMGTCLIAHVFWTSTSPNREGCAFRLKPNTDSERKRTAVPAESEQRFRG